MEVDAISEYSSSPYYGVDFQERGRRRDSNEAENVARGHPYYHSATLGSDGLYHCPWEKTCNHKPEKLKCNYEYVFLSSFRKFTN
jgi:hypothetical protein